MSRIKQIDAILDINGDGYEIQTHEIMPWKGIELDHFSKPPDFILKRQLGGGWAIRTLAGLLARYPFSRRNP